MYLRHIVPVLLAAALPLSVSAATSETIAINAQPGPNPWTSLELNNNPDNFHFAVVSDRNGGGRPEVFDDAVTKLNLLQPEFVMSVGDFIPGYNKNRQEIGQMWDDFHRTIARLKVPFFYTFGNHDLTNPTEIEENIKRHGRLYYHFVYRNVLFMVVNSEDPSIARISKEQVEYFKKALAENPNVRWTVLFMHHPLWLSKSYKNKEENFEDPGWNALEESLAGRRYSVFAGHVHNYTSYNRNGRKYIVLATTGGGSALRGIDNYGEFDEVVWVTMTDKGPVVANLALNGIRDEDLRTNEQAEIIDPIVRDGVRSKTLVLEPATTSPLKTTVHLTNRTTAPMHVSIAFDPHDQIEVDPDTLQTTVAAESAVDEQFTVQPQKLSKRSDYEPLSFKWNVAFDSPGIPRINLDGTRMIGLERPLSCAQASKNMVVDGKLNDWKNLPFEWKFTRAWGPPKRLAKNPKNLSYRFGTSYDDKYVYVAMAVVDNHLVINNKVKPWEQDGVEIRIDARPDPERSEGIGEGSGKDFIFLAVNPSTSSTQPAVFQPEDLPKGTLVASSVTKDGYIIEAAIPVEYFNSRQGGKWSAFRMNVFADDSDNANVARSVQYPWKPDWRSAQNYAGSGTFVRK